jgi:hypothetical protein
MILPYLNTSLVQVRDEMNIHDWQKSYWEDFEGNKTSIRIINFLLKDVPVVSLKISDLTHVPSVLIEEHRKKTADLSFPIIVVEKDGNFQYILDGHHRRQRAIDEKRTHILAKVFRGEVISES